MKHIVSSALLVSLASVGAVMAQSPAQEAQPRPVVLQRVLVKVNGAIFTKVELEQLQIDELTQQNQRQLSQMDLQNDATLRAELIKITPQILSEAVDMLIITQRGREIGLRMSDAQFKQYLDNIKKENPQITDDRMLETELAKQGMTMDQLRKRLEQQYLYQGVMQRDVVPRIAITEEEARQYYRAHPEEFMTPAKVTVREITVLVPAEARGINAAADEAAHAKINAAYERAKKGEDFTALVTEYSQSGSKANGGLIGPLNLSELADSLRTLLSPLKTGDIAEPIRTGIGYQLIKIEEKEDSSVEPFEKVRLEVGDKVQGLRNQAEMAKFLSSLRDQAIIEWKDEDLRKMYESYRASQKQGS